MEMVIDLKETGEMVKDAVKDCMSTLMAMFMRDNGLLTTNKELVVLKWQLEIDIKVNGLLVKKTVQVFL